MYVHKNNRAPLNSNHRCIIMSQNKLAITFVAVLVSVFLYAACGGSSEVEVATSAGGGSSEVVVATSTNGDCQATINAKCVKCHYKTRICDALGTKSKRKWKRTIKFMVKQGAQLSKEEQVLVADCLSTMPKGSDIVCK